MVILSILSFTVALPNVPASSPPSLSVGDFWALTETTDRMATGTGAYAGDCSMHETGRIMLTVASLKETTMVLRSDYQADYEFSGHGLFVSTNELCSSYSSDNTVSITVDLSVLRVVSIDPSSADVNGLVGRTPWFMVSPNEFSAGSVLSSWVSPSVRYTDVQWTVAGSQVLTVNGQSINAYSFTYSGQSVGNWKDVSSNIWSNGPAMDNRLYDAAYGIYVGSSAVGKFTYEASNGGWTETFSRKRQLLDTNIKFPNVNAANIEYSTVTRTEQVAMQFGISNPIVIAGIAILVSVAVSAIFLSHRRKRTDYKQESSAEERNPLP